MAKTLSGLRAIIRQFLKDEFQYGTALVWEDDELDIYIADCLGEISERRPYLNREVLTTIDNSRVLDISSIENLLRIDKLEYPTDSDPRDYRNFIQLDAETIEIDTTLDTDAGGSGTLTGTITFTNGSAAVTGSGSLFTTELDTGYLIRKSTGTRWYRVYSITNATTLTLAGPCLETTAADVASATAYCYEAVYVYCEKLHTLTETSSTLSPQLENLLILGVTARAAIVKARSLVNKINIGGGRTPTDMQAWGISQLALYRASLKRLAKPKTKRQYPTD